MLVVYYVSAQVNAIFITGVTPLHRKTIFGLISTIFLASCSTLSGDDQAASIADENVRFASVEAELMEAKIEINRLQEENARLVAAALDATRERERAPVASRPSEEVIADAGAPTLPDSPSVVVEEALELQANVEDAVVEGTSDSDADLLVGDVPVDPAPRLVQPAFTSGDAVFENEATADAIVTQSVLYGVHLASYRAVDEARRGWSMLQRANPDELGLLEPRTKFVRVPNKGEFFRLIGGGFSSRDKASALCESLKAKRVYCGITDFDGERLSLGQSIAE